MKLRVKDLFNKVLASGKKLSAGACVVLLTATGIAKENKADTEYAGWDAQEQENVKICSKLPNSRYVLPNANEYMLNNLHGICYSTDKKPVYNEQLESVISYETGTQASIMTFIRNADGSITVQAFAGENQGTELEVTFTNAKSCLNSCPANTIAVIDHDVETERACECLPVKQAKKNMMTRTR